MLFRLCNFLLMAISMTDNACLC